MAWICPCGKSNGDNRLTCKGCGNSPFQNRGQAVPSPQYSYPPPPPGNAPPQQQNWNQSPPPNYPPPQSWNQQQPPPAQYPYPPHPPPPSYYPTQPFAGDLPKMVQSELSTLSQSAHNAFVEEYNRRSKSVGVGYLLWLFLGWHYAYLGKWGVQLLYWLSIGGLFIWCFIDLFRVPSMVRDYNKDVAIDVLRDLRGVSR